MLAGFALCLILQSPKATFPAQIYAISYKPDKSSWSPDGKPLGRFLNDQMQDPAETGFITVWFVLGEGVADQPTIETRPRSFGRFVGQPKFGWREFESRYPNRWVAAVQIPRGKGASQSIELGLATGKWTTVAKLPFLGSEAPDGKPRKDGLQVTRETTLGRETITLKYPMVSGGKANERWVVLRASGELAYTGMQWSSGNVVSSTFYSQDAATIEKQTRPMVWKKFTFASRPKR